MGTRREGETRLELVYCGHLVRGRFQLCRLSASLSSAIGLLRQSALPTTVSLSPSLSLPFFSIVVAHVQNIWAKKRCSHNKNIGKLWRKLIDSHLSTSCCCCCCCSCRLSIVGCACWRCFDCFVKLSKISKQLAAVVISCSFSLSISISCLDVVF